MIEQRTSLLGQAIVSQKSVQTRTKESTMTGDHTQQFKMIRKSAEDAAATNGQFGASGTLSFSTSTLVFTTSCLLREALCPGYRRLDRSQRWTRGLSPPAPHCSLLSAPRCGGALGAVCGGRAFCPGQSGCPETSGCTSCCPELDAPDFSSVLGISYPVASKKLSFLLKMKLGRVPWLVVGGPD